jgi:hypothetical protein
MLEGVRLDQFRTFIVAADEGSFSGAGRHLKRARSVISISQTLANLEGQIGVRLFDRSGRFPHPAPAHSPSTAQVPDRHSCFATAPPRDL